MRCIKCLLAFNGLVFFSFMSDALAQNYYTNYYSLEMPSSSSLSSSSMSSVVSSSSSMSSIASSSSSSISSEDYEDDYTDDNFNISSSTGSFPSAEANTQDFYSAASAASLSPTGWSYRYCSIDINEQEFNCFCSVCDPDMICTVNGC